MNKLNVCVLFGGVSLLSVLIVFFTLGRKLRFQKGSQLVYGFLDALCRISCVEVRE